MSAAGRSGLSFEGCVAHVGAATRRGGALTAGTRTPSAVAGEVEEGNVAAGWTTFTRDGWMVG